ncbi:MAG: DUF362 domain-containing protein [Prolixibacteraceae bacterium]
MNTKQKKLFASYSNLKLSFFILGIGSTIWFLLRVIPKPSRATYPCMRASAPFMSAFVIYLIGLASTIWIFRNNRGKLFFLKGALALVFVVSLLISFQVTSPEAKFELVDTSYFQPNKPIGIAHGIFPGRVAWIYNPLATNKDMTNKQFDYWASDKNCNETIVDSMLISGIRRIGGKANIKEAWNEIFKYYNSNHGKGSVGYKPGEKFAVKINTTNSCCGNVGYNRIDASPQLVICLLRQLIDVVGVAQEDIWLGDNYRKFRDEYFNPCYSEFPNVHYVDGNGGNGREKTVPSADQVLKFSDGKETASLPQHYLDASYLINMPCLKTHNEGGITLAAKNHQGSILHSGDDPANQSAYYMHYCLPANKPGLKQYRHMVDYMGHQELGGKTLLYLVDGLWAGKSWEGWLEKWQMAPFNGDYPSSLFLSQDAVAIESVCYDFLLTEYASKPSGEKYPYMIGADDYMLQAADPANWPTGVSYDPENDGSMMKSLGVYEHWNNAADKQYSRNLETGNGIELISYTALATDNYQSEITTNRPERKLVNYSLYPNPFSKSIRIDVNEDQDLSLNIFNLKGQQVFKATINKTYIWKGTSQNGAELPKGIYLIRLSEKNSGNLLWTEKIIFNKSE